MLKLTTVQTSSHTITYVHDKIYTYLDLIWKYRQQNENKNAETYLTKGAGRKNENNSPKWRRLQIKTWIKEHQSYNIVFKITALS